MGAASSDTMADVTVMEKQLVAKTRQNAELQGKLTEKMRRLHDLEQDLERKDRSIYFLERDMDSRSRALGKLRLRSNNLEQLAAKQGFAAHVDEGEAKLAVALARVEAKEGEFAQAKLAREHMRTLASAYENVSAKLSPGVNAEKVVELLQAELNALDQQHGEDKQHLAELKGAIKEQEDTFIKLRGQARFLESYRVDAIFRVFSLKGQGRILQNDINAAVNKRRDQLGIKRRYHHTDRVTV